MNYFFTFVLSVTLLLQGCGGGVGENTSSYVSPNTPKSNAVPLADAGSDKSVAQGMVVTFDGSGSYDADGDSLTYLWSITNKPIGSTTTLSLSSSETPTMVPDVVGTYTIQLIVNDGVVDSLIDTTSISSFIPISPLSDTGQTSSFTNTFGEDSDYIINPPAYTDNGDGTVTDTITGLMWQSSDDDNTYNWYEAEGSNDAVNNPGNLNVCGSLNTGGYTDWRLPTYQELLLIINYEVIPEIEIPFNEKNIINWESYWSSTTDVSSPLYPSYAWHVNSRSGSTNSKIKSDNLYVKCVRGGQLSFGDFTDNGNGTVIDMSTSLIWQQHDDDTRRTWESAINYCEALDFAGVQDWRLPNIKELMSIIDDTVSHPSINTAFFPGTSLTVYWASTSSDIYVNYSSVAGGVMFGSCAVGWWGDGNDNYYVRCVRGGQ